MNKQNYISYIFFFFILNFPSANAEDKITFLDLDSVLNSSIVGKLIIKDLDQIKKSNEINFKKKSEILVNKERDIISKKNILSKEEFESNLLNLQKEINKFNEEKKKEIMEFEKIRNNKLDQFMKKIEPLIQDYVNKNSISIVLNQKNLFIGNRKYDITLDIINIIDKNIKNEKIEQNSNN